jgi:hypothetical protein
MRGAETIDSELRVLSVIRHVVREDGEPATRAPRRCFLGNLRNRQSIADHRRHTVRHHPKTKCQPSAEVIRFEVRRQGFEPRTR